MKRWINIVLVVLSVGNCVQGWAHDPMYHYGPGKEMKGEIVEMTAEDQQFTYYLYAAQSALDADRYDDALALSEFAYRIKPDDPTINYFLGILYKGLGREDDALARLKVAYEGSPTNYWRYYFAMLYNGKDGSEKREAWKVIEREAKRQSDDTEVLETYQQVLLSEGKFRKALKVQDRIERLEGRTPYHILQRYRILLMEGKEKEAVQVIEDYCKEDPDDYYFQALRGDIYLALGQKEKALLTYTLAYNDHPDNPYLLQSLARYYKAEKAVKEERKTLDALMAIAPEGQVLDRYFELLSEDSTVSNEEQVAFVQKAYLMEPHRAKWHYYWGLALAQRDSLSAAMSVLEEGLRLGEGEPVIRFSMHVLCGDLYMRQEKLDSCYAHYEKALILDPENVYVLNNYAYTLSVNGGDLKKAEKMSQKTIEKEPNNPTYLDTYAWILHLQGQDTLAQFYMQRAMEKMGTLGAGEIDNEEVLMHYKVIMGH